jgi:hypothetical protein
MADLEIAEKLMDQGFHYLEEYQFDKAIKVGKKLKKLRHSSAFK